MRHSSIRADGHAMSVQGGRRRTVCTDSRKGRRRRLCHALRQVDTLHCLGDNRRCGPLDVRGSRTGTAPAPPQGGEAAPCAAVPHSLCCRHDPACMDATYMRCTACSIARMHFIAMRWACGLHSHPRLAPRREQTSAHTLTKMLEPLLLQQGSRRQKREWQASLLCATGAPSGLTPTAWQHANGGQQRCLHNKRCAVGVAQHNVWATTLDAMRPLYATQKVGVGSRRVYLHGDVHWLRHQVGDVGAQSWLPELLNARFAMHSSCAHACDPTC